MDSEFLFKFGDAQMKNSVLENGPWFIAQTPLLLTNWESGFILEKLSPSRIPVWIKLRKVPLELFTAAGLSHIASAIGFPLYMDRATKLCRRVSFARVCVEVRKEDEQPDIIPIDIEGIEHTEMFVEYAWRPKFCSICTSLGKNDQKCTKVSKVWIPKKVDQSTESTINKGKEMAQDNIPSND